ISARNTAEQFGFSYSTTEYEEIFKEPGSHCVFIATRHDLHAGLAVEALRRGKAVFVEKPLAINAEELGLVAAAAQESGGLLMVGYNRRFAPLAKQIKGQLGARAGPMTIMYRVNAGQLPAEHWSLNASEGGGRIIGEVCHFIDFIQCLTDALPARICAEDVGSNRAAGFVDDSVTISMRM